MRRSDLKEWIRGEIKEIQVNKPLNKKQVFEYLKEYPYVLSRLIDNNSLNDFIEYYGKEDLESIVLDDLEGEENNKLSEKGKELKQYIESYYKVFSPGDMQSVEIENNDQDNYTINIIKNFSKMDIVSDESIKYMFFHNL